jgi:hypothetical protein
VSFSSTALYHRIVDEAHSLANFTFFKGLLQEAHLDKKYDGRDKSVKVKAVLIDNEEQAAADRHAEYDSKNGILGTILDYILAFTLPH